MHSSKSASRDCCEQGWELSLAPLVTPGGLLHNPYKVLKDGYLPTVGNANALKNMNDTNVSDLDVSKAPSIAPPSSSDLLVSLFRLLYGLCFAVSSESERCCSALCRWWT